MSRTTRSSGSPRDPRRSPAATRTPSADPATHPAAHSLAERRRRAELLLKDLRSAEPARVRAAAQRFAQLPWLTPAAGLSREEHVVRTRDTMQHKHALHVIALEEGHPSWAALSEHLRQASANRLSQADADPVDPVRGMLERAMAGLRGLADVTPTAVRSWTVKAELDLLAPSLADASARATTLLERFRAALREAQAERVARLERLAERRHALLETTDAPTDAATRETTNDTTNDTTNVTTPAASTHRPVPPHRAWTRHA